MNDALESVRVALAPAYAIERELGAGGMATVYLAREVKHDRLVAIKVLKTDVAQSLGRERFIREIQLAARLTHPHILPLHDSGEADGFLYYVMPVMQGETLRARMTFGALPIDAALHIAGEVADALDYAHRHDIVHRDIKPENILLHEGHAVVADFGIGKALVEAANDTTTHTQMGVAVGTPAYMSPEQAAGDSVDGRSDLFSLGCTLFEMLTGEPPFAAATLHGTISKRFYHVPPPVSASHPAVPSHVSRAVERLLEKSPDDRFTSGALVALALRGKLALPPRREPPSIAVLPFANMSSESDNEFFSDGITDDIILALTRVRGLKVAARTSAFSFKGKDVGLAEIGERLGVRHVLQGGVRRAGKRVRVTAQLMSTAGGVQVWSERWDRDLDDIFAIQDEIAHAIVDHLEVALGLKGTELVERPTGDMQAYELYLRGREEIRRRTQTSIRNGLDLLARAIARDAGYAQAWLVSAEAYAALGVYGYETTAVCRKHAEEALDRAASAGVVAGEVALYRAMVKLYLRPDWPGADVELDEALAANPNSSLGLVMSALWHAAMGHAVSRTAAVSRFLAIDPLSPWAHSMAGLSYFITGEFQASLTMHEAALKLDGNALSSLWGSAMCYSHLGDVPAALRWSRRAVEVSGGAPTMVGMLSYVLFAAGQPQEARALAEGVLAQDPEHAYWELLAAIRSGDDDWLALALAEAVKREAGCISLGSTIKHELEALLFHPVHGAMVRRLHLFSQRPDVVARR